MRWLHLSIPIMSYSSYQSDFTVVGEGSVDVTPDIAYVEVGIVVDNLPTAKQVQDKIAKVNNDIVLALKSFQVATEDVKTTNYSINPSYNYTDGKQRPDGYDGSARLQIKVRDKDRVGEVIQAITAAGANEIYNTRFAIDAPEKYREQARDKAIKHAQEQAAKLSRQFGVRLGKVTGYTESYEPSTVQPYVDGGVYKSMDAGQAPAELQPGTETIRSTVTLFYERR
jgi:uncharacterized protein YggE